MALCEATRDYIARCLTEQSAYGFLEHLCSRIGPRQAGTASEKQAVQYAVDHFAECGYETRMQPFDYTGWQTKGSTVFVHEQGRQRRLAGLALGWSPKGSVTGSVVDAGYGTARELESSAVKGRIALVSNASAPGSKPLHRSEKYGYAFRAGAKGFLLYSDKPGGVVPMGSVNLSSSAGPIPAAGISYEDGMHIRRQAARVTVEISVDSRVEQTTSYNGLGLKTGDSTGEIVVCAHIDTWQCPGAYDNGSGTAMVLELARLLSRYELRRSLRFAVFGAEELGLFGSTQYVADLAGASGITAVFNCDCSAIRDGQPSIVTSGNPSLYAFAEDIRCRLRFPLSIRDERMSYSDHQPFQEIGVPCANVVSRGAQYAFAHTAFDTLDKVSPEAFTVPLLMLGVVILELAQSDSTFR